jgi:RNA polymerase sigma factor (sigma-70 family)
MPPDDRSSALEALLTRYAAMVRHVGRAHGLCDTDVDEVFQEIRIRLWRARGSGESIASVPTSYLYRTAVSAALDLIRHRRGRASTEWLDVEGVGGSDTALVHPATPDDTMQAMETREAVEQAVEELVPSRRPVVRMYLMGYSREDIAGLLGWTEAKTRNLLYRGLAELREHLAARGIHREGVR